jgi:hypothetical protein
MKQSEHTISLSIFNATTYAQKQFFILQVELPALALNPRLLHTAPGHLFLAPPDDNSFLALCHFAPRTCPTMAAIQPVGAHVPRTERIK